jgi:hypothetical protein
MNNNDAKLQKDISYHTQMMGIWHANEKKLREQMSENS